MDQWIGSLSNVPSRPGKIFYVSQELPLDVVYNPIDSSWSLTIKKTQLLPTLWKHRADIKDGELIFVGLPNIINYLEKELTHADKREIDNLLEANSCIPVWLSPILASLYNDFSMKYMWHVFHSVPYPQPMARTAPYTAMRVLPKFDEHDRRAYVAYQKANMLFAERLVAWVDKGDIVWVNDIYLLLLPQQLKRKIRTVSVGLFIHVPFPSSESFRMLPIREQLLHGMLCADVIGFHFFEYARHFIVACKRLLGFGNHFKLGGFLCIEAGGREVLLTEKQATIEGADIIRKMLDSSNYMIKGPVMMQVDGNEYYRASYKNDSSSDIDQLACMLSMERPTDDISMDIDCMTSPEQKIKESPEDPPISVKDLANRIREKYGPDKFIIICIDRLCTLAGIGFKLMAFQKFLDSYHYANRRCILLQYCYPTPHESIASAKFLVNEIMDLANNINKRNRGNEKIVEVKIGPITPEERHAIFLSGDCYLDLSLRDGLNLNPYEYLLCRGNKPAYVILSEFIGSSSTLSCALKVNPWDDESVLDALDTCLNQQARSESLIRLLRKDRERLATTSTVKWAEHIIRDIQRQTNDSAGYTYTGFGNNLRVLRMDDNFQQVDIQALSYKFRHSRKRCLFLDYEGTLTPDKSTGESHNAEFAAPTEEVVAMLEALADDENTAVTIMSGRAPCHLDTWFGHIKNLGLASEHGFYIRYPRRKGSNWAKAPSEGERESSGSLWKPLVLSLMGQYADRTAGAFIENKGSAITFQYRDADIDCGSWQARNMTSHLHDMVSSEPVEVISGKGYVEVRMRNVDKGIAMNHILQYVRNTLHWDVDFIMAMGDDRSDEYMFKVLNNSDSGSSSPGDQESPAHPLPNQENIFTVTVERKPSDAHYYVHDSGDAINILRSLNRGLK